MALTKLLLCAFSLSLLSYGWPEASKSHNSSDLLSTCNRIVSAISNVSQVFFPCEHVILSFFPNLIGDKAASEYLFDISHASSASSEASACSVEPGSAEDVSKIVR
jgi:hypothetical protein